MDLETFRIFFPEFKGVSDTMAQAYLDAAEIEVDEEVWGTTTPQGHGYLTAHRLALSPYGQGARLAAKDGTTIYYTHFQRLRAAAACGEGRVC